VKGIVWAGREFVASAWTTSLCWARRICAESCESILVITIL
jgi:hypothetical protein